MSLIYVVVLRCINYIRELIFNLCDLHIKLEGDLPVTDGEIRNQIHRRQCALYFVTVLVSWMMDFADFLFGKATGL